MKGLVGCIIIVAIAVLLLSVRVILKKNGRFSSQHISQNKRMRERGIHCAMTQHREAQNDAKKKINVKNL
ncbi:MAG: hypothetical protein MJZ53_03300 [Paludibacteraceae bacterium]|nr:hypothetical protein [Paludibacteraceae bacterium]